MNYNTEFYKAIKAINIKDLTAEDKEELLNVFASTNNHAVRNHLALVFSDLHYNEAIPSMIKKTGEQKLYNRNGTIVFALGEMETQKYFMNFIKVICEQAYEARTMAYSIIKQYSSSISKRTRNRALKTLEVYRLKQGILSDDEYDNSTLHFIEATEKLLLNDNAQSTTPMS